MIPLRAIQSQSALGAYNGLKRGVKKSPIYGVPYPYSTKYSQISLVGALGAFRFAQGSTFEGGTVSTS